MGQLTELLAAHRSGDTSASEQIFTAVYAELRRLASGRLGTNAREQTLSATGLVHECYIKLTEAGQLKATDRQHFFALAARVMRQVVVDYARERKAAKRSGGSLRVSLEDAQVAVDDNADFLIDLEAALRRLEERSERLVRVVECRYFVGMTESGTASLLDMSVRSVQRDWQQAKVLLAEMLAAKEGH